MGIQKHLMNYLAFGIELWLFYFDADWYSILKADKKCLIKK